MDAQLRTSRATRWLIVLLAVPLLLRAFELRLPGMVRPYWQDEIHHNIPVLESPTAAALDGNGMYLAMMQPKLDFWMRKVFWFPAFGLSERTMRLPALLFGIALVLLVYGLLIAFFRKQWGARAATLLALLGALWIVDAPIAVRNAIEARHYSMVLFASTLWFGVLLLFDGKPRWLLGLSALFLANAHFFALPLIACGYGLQVLRELKARQYRWIALHAAVCAAIYWCTTGINGPPFTMLLVGPPGDRGTLRAPLAALFTREVLANGWEVWLGYSRALAVPPATWVVWLVMMLAVVVRRQWRWLPALVTAFGLLPAMFVYMRFRSQYPWGERYYAPFFGLGVVTVAAGISIVAAETRLLCARMDGRRRLIAAAVVATGLLLFGGPTFAYHTLVDVGRVQRVPANFSPWYRAYEEVWREQRPTVIVHNWCYTSDIPHLYLRYLLPKANYSYLAFDLCQGDLPRVKSILSEYLAKTPNAAILLDEKETDCTGRVLPPIPPPAVVERVRVSPQCMWKVRSVGTVAVLADIARLVGFRAAGALR